MSSVRLEAPSRLHAFALNRAPLAQNSTSHIPLGDALGVWPFRTLHGGKDMLFQVSRHAFCLLPRAFTMFRRTTVRRIAQELPRRIWISCTLWRFERGLRQIARQWASIWNRPGQCLALRYVRHVVSATSLSDPGNLELCDQDIGMEGTDIRMGESVIGHRLALRPQGSYAGLFRRVYAGMSS